MRSFVVVAALLAGLASGAVTDVGSCRGGGGEPQGCCGSGGCQCPGSEPGPRRSGMDQGCDCGPASPEPLPPQGSPIAPNGQAEPLLATDASTAAAASPEPDPSRLGLRSERGRPPDRAVFLLDRSLRI